MSTSMLLGSRGKVPFIGPETGTQKANGVARFKSPHGSVRYVLYVERTPVAALQLVVTGPHVTVANVFTDPSTRSRGYASRLLAAARRDYPALRHAEPVNRTDAGDAWIRSLERRRR